MSKIDSFERKFEKEEVQKDSNTKYTVIGIAVVATIFLILFAIALLIHSSIENSTKTSSKNSHDEKDFVDALQIIPGKTSLEEIQDLLNDDGNYYDSSECYNFEIYYANSYNCNLSVCLDSDTELVDYFSLWITYVDKDDYEDAVEKLLDEYTKKFGTPTPQYDDKSKKLTGYLWNGYSPSINDTGFQYVHLELLPSTYSNTTIYIFCS